MTITMISQKVSSFVFKISSKASLIVCGVTNLQFLIHSFIHLQFHRKYN